MRKTRSLDAHHDTVFVLDDRFGCRRCDQSRKRLATLGLAIAVVGEV